MKRFLAIALLLALCISGTAQAALYKPNTFYKHMEDYLSRMGYTDVTDWVEVDKHARVYQCLINGEALITLCIHEGDIAAVSVVLPQDANDAETLYENLAAATLTAAGVVAEDDAYALVDKVVTSYKQEKKHTVVEHKATAIATFVYDKNVSFVFSPTNHYETLVFEPLQGGARMHVNPFCSWLDGPRLLSKEAAHSLGYTACGICMKTDSKITPYEWIKE